MEELIVCLTKFISIVSLTAALFQVSRMLTVLVMVGVSKAQIGFNRALERIGDRGMR
jgi:hypothetical protein